jgi:hypothetical protein
MRTNVQITDTEKAIYSAFYHQHHILNDEAPLELKTGNTLEVTSPSGM